MPPAVGQIVLAAYAFLLMAGGIMGYAKARSRPSLIAGLATGTAVLIALALTLRSATLGFQIGLAVALMMTVLFGVRLARTRKAMPAGAILGASIAVAAALAILLARPSA